MGGNIYIETTAWQPLNETQVNQTRRKNSFALVQAFEQTTSHLKKFDIAEDAADKMEQIDSDWSELDENLKLTIASNNSHSAWWWLN